MDGSDDTGSKLWLPGHALDCYEGNAALRSWLRTPGLLTQRIRDGAGAAFRMTLVDERGDGDAGHLREIEMGCGEVPWMFARTRVPRATLERHPWLARIGTTTLGEALQAHGRVTRSEFDYARLYDDVEVVRLALGRAALTAQPLWVRRSTFHVDGLPLVLQEVFLPQIGRPGG
jgi:chorismate--pyruvate lyase